MTAAFRAPRLDLLRTKHRSRNNCRGWGFQPQRCGRMPQPLWRPTSVSYFSNDAKAIASFSGFIAIVIEARISSLRAAKAKVEIT
jgi:hypothetical protein